MCHKRCQRRIRQELRIRFLTPLFLAESFAQLIDVIRNETMKKIVLLKFQRAMNGAVASELNCTQTTLSESLSESAESGSRRDFITGNSNEGGQKDGGTTILKSRGSVKAQFFGQISVALSGLFAF